MGHPISSVPDVRGTDARSRKRARPEDITHGFHVSLYKVDPVICVSACRLLAKDNDRATLPDQLTHVLRHTFAAHFMMSGGNILALQKILGHHDIKMTMRYAHLAPDHLETALRFNPLATLPMAQTNFDMPRI